MVYMDVSENNGTPKSSILVGFSIINHPFWGTPIFGNIHILHNHSDQTAEVTPKGCKQQGNAPKISLMQVLGTIVICPENLSTWMDDVHGKSYVNVCKYTMDGMG